MIRPAVRFALLALAWPGPAGCAQVLGADDYKNVANRDAGALPSQRDADTLFDPKPPYLSGEACRRCQDQHCADERRACDADKFCPDAFDHRESDPVAGHRTRFLPPIAELLWQAYHDPTALNPIRAIIPYHDCLNQYCAEACELGRDFSCAGEFDWPTTEAGEKEIRYMVFDENFTGGEGWDLGYCLGYSCDSPRDFVTHVKADREGFATFEVDPGDMAYETIGFVRVEPGPDAYPIEIMLPAAPIESGFFNTAMVFSKGKIDDPFDELGGVAVDESPTTGTIWAFPRDCRGDPARHVIVEVLIANEVGKGYTPCDSCQTVYTNDMYFYGYPDPDRMELDSAPGRAILANLPARHARVVVRDTLTRRPVATRHLVVHGQVLQYADVWPLSRRERDELAIVLR